MMSGQRRFQGLIFDLDDTILDTSEQITPRLFRTTAEAMIQAGLKATVDQCVQFRADFLASNPRQKVFETLVKHFGSSNPAATIAAAIKVFYSAPLAMPVSVSPKTKTLLSDLGNHHELYLVTAGEPELQHSKVKRLGIEGFFKKVFYVNSQKGEHKRNAFFEILNATRFQPERILSIGNRVDTEIAQSKELEITTCLIRKGEYTLLKPVTSFEIPDFIIYDLEELREICDV